MLERLARLGLLDDAGVRVAEKPGDLGHGGAGLRQVNCCRVPEGVNGDVGDTGLPETVPNFVPDALC